MRRGELTCDCVANVRPSGHEVVHSRPSVVDVRHNARRKTKGAADLHAFEFFPGIGRGGA